jgi:hypothetical protein
MIATPRFVFLHLHKSGGTFVNECLLRYVPGARQLGYHLPRSALPVELAGRPVLGFVRNPWSYYVSWHAFQAARPNPNPLFSVLSDAGRLGFVATISRMLALGRDDRLLEEVAAALPDRYTKRGLNLPGFALAPIRGSGLGFYAYLFRYIYGADTDGPLRIGRMEQLRSDLLELLAWAGEPVGENLRRHVLEAAPSNASEHAGYTDYYPDELRDLVAERDAPLIERFGYRFGA